MKNDSVKQIKSVAFDWVFKALVGFACWLVLDMHNDLKSVLEKLPVLELKISNLEDGQLLDRFKRLRIPMKNEEQITLDSLTNTK